MYKKLTIILSIFFVLDATLGSPINEETTTQQALRKRDVSLLKNFYKNDETGKDAEIIFSVYTIALNDNYYFAYKQSDGQEREETGIYEYDAEKNERVLKVKGFYEYIRPDGKKQRVEYTADDQGFHPIVTES